MTGYHSREYAESLEEFGVPVELTSSDGWILKRKIPGFESYDAMGCYPLFTCGSWSGLNQDLTRIESEKELVCLSAVTDPLGEYDPDVLRECFPDVMIPFKQHYVVDLTRPADGFVAPHHKRNARRALREFQIEKCATPENLLEDWTALYSTLVERHGITGFAAFSRESFARQLRVPGIVVFSAVREGATAGMLLWYAQGDKAYYHLGAYSSQGYELGASFALFSYSLEYFADREFSRLNLGAGAGAVGDADSGLSRFKKGWSTGKRTAYFCGRVFDNKRYNEIVKARGMRQTDYFPAYRRGEFR